MAAAPVESCQSLPKRSPWGRLGSVLYTCKRLHRMRRRFKHFWSISLNASSATTGPFYGFDGPVAEPSEWAFVKVPPGVEMMYHTAGEGYKKAVADAS